MKKSNLKNHLYVLAHDGLAHTDLGLELQDTLESLGICFKLSSHTFDNSLQWISAKEPNMQKEEEKDYIFDSELLVLYYNSTMFVKDYTSGKLITDLGSIYSFYSSKSMKVLILLQSVSDTLYNCQEVTREMYDQFLIELTCAFQFDYIELKTTAECFTLIRDLHEWLEKKPERRELLLGDMYVSKKGAKITKKATMEGFHHELSLYWINMLMTIPGVSENKAISIAKIYNHIHFYYFWTLNKLIIFIQYS
jgi:hypothetical protein